MSDMDDNVRAVMQLFEREMREKDRAHVRRNLEAVATPECERSYLCSMLASRNQNYREVALELLSTLEESPEGPGRVA